MNGRSPTFWLLALLCMAIASAAPAFADVPCDDHDVTGPFSAEGDNAGQCKANVLSQVDCVQLCGQGECPRQGPFLNRCMNVAKVFTNLQWFRDSHSCTVDVIHCLCRCADSGPGSVGPGACGNGEIDPGEECDPGDSTLAAPSDFGSECPAGGTCNADCTCGEPPVCGNSVVEDGEDCDPPDASCPEGGLCGATCACVDAPICGNGTVESGESCDPPGAACGSVCDSSGCHTVPCSSSCSCCGNALVGPGEQCDPPGSLCTACDEAGCYGSSCTSACTCERPE